MLSCCPIFLVIRCTALHLAALKHSLLLPNHWWKVSWRVSSLALIAEELSIRCTHMEKLPVDNYFWICHLASRSSYCNPYWLHILLILGGWTRPRSPCEIQLDTLNTGLTSFIGWWDLLPVKLYWLLIIISSSSNFSLIETLIIASEMLPKINIQISRLWLPGPRGLPCVCFGTLLHALSLWNDLSIHRGINIEYKQAN